MMTKEKLNIVILAAGKGTRMRSNQPKVLHEIGGKSILGHVLDCAKNLKPEKIIVIYGFGGDLLQEVFKEERVIWAEQKEQLGTGHAARQALPYLDASTQTLLLLGDVPLVNAEACKGLIEKASNQLVIQSFKKSDPTGYGRIVRNHVNSVVGVVEHKDATVTQRAINEVNTGVMAMPTNYLKNWLTRLNNNNAQMEYYLTDIVGFAVADNVKVIAEVIDDEWSVTGVNSKQDLALIERVHQHRHAAALLQQGVTLLDPARIDIRGRLKVGKEVTIDIGCVFEGEVTLEDAVTVGANCVIKDAKIKSGTIIAPFTHISESEIGSDSRIGPYARLRPGTVLADQTHVGNFVELKNMRAGIGSKINHLSYIGDAVIGQKVNIGAGTITCNYDGVNKFQTTIEDEAFIGSDTQLIAPVTIGRAATIAAGSTITKDAPADTLTLCRTKDQKSIKGWKRPKKLKKE